MIVTIPLLAGLIYLVLGALFTIPFLLRGIFAIDHRVKGSSWGFYIIIIPGVILLWPVLLTKWIGRAKKIRP